MDTENFSIIGSELPHSGQHYSDKKAIKESKALFGDANRNENAKQHLHQVFICFVWIAGLTFIALFIIRMLHFILPDSLCWLDEHRIQAIDKSLFSGAIGGLIMNHIKQTLPSKSKSED